MACNCINDGEARIVAQLKENNPEKSYNEKLNGFEGTGFQNKALDMSEGGSYKLYHEFKIESTFIKGNGEVSKPKKESINIYPTFCSFCGTKL